MNRTEFRILLRTTADVEHFYDEVGGMFDAADKTGASNVSRVANQEVLIECDGFRIQAITSISSVVETHTTHNRFNIEFFVSRQTQQALGLAWDILAMGALALHADVWLGSSWRERITRLLGEPRPLSFTDGACGFLLTSDEFESLIESG